MDGQTGKSEENAEGEGAGMATRGSWTATRAISWIDASGEGDKEGDKRVEDDEEDCLTESETGKPLTDE